MADFARKCLDNWVLTVNGSLEQHQKMIRATLAKRAYELFELRGREHGLHLEDWVIAEKELVHQNVNGNSSGFCILVDCPRDPDITTILSVTMKREPVQVERGKKSTCRNQPKAFSFSTRL